MSGLVSGLAHLAVGAPTTGSSLNIPELLALLLSAAALLFAALAFVNDRVLLLTDLRSRWEELHDDWASVALLFRGSDDYYSDASMSERARVEELMSYVEDESVDITKRVNLLRAETRQVRRVGRYLAYVADAVLRGRISIEDAYAILGPDVARHHHLVSWIAGRYSARAGDLTPYNQISIAWASWVDQSHEPHFYSEQADIVALVSLLRSEVSRRGDTYGHLILEYAMHLKAYEAGAVVRSEVRRQVRGWKKLWLVPKFWVKLRGAERVKVSAVFEREPNLLGPVDPSLFARTLGSQRLTARRIRNHELRRLLSRP